MPVNHERRLTALQSQAAQQAVTQRALAGGAERVRARLGQIRERQAADGPLPEVDADELQARLQALRPVLLAAVERMQ